MKTLIIISALLLSSCGIGKGAQNEFFYTEPESGNKQLAFKKPTPMIFDFGAEAWTSTKIADQVMKITLKDSANTQSVVIQAMHRTELGSPNLLDKQVIQLWAEKQTDSVMLSNASLKNSGFSYNSDQNTGMISLNNAKQSMAFGAKVYQEEFVYLISCSSNDPVNPSINILKGVLARMRPSSEGQIREIARNSD